MNVESPMNLSKPKLGIFLCMYLCTSLPLHGQHDGARDAVRQIVDGKYRQVASTLENKQPFAGEAESRFVEMLNLLAQHRPAEALKKARSAVDNGLPFERLVVGPRELLSRLHTLPEFTAWHSEVKPSKLIHGPMLGDMSDVAASFWVRTAQVVDVEVRLKDQPEKSDRNRTSPDTDYTAVLTLSELSPDTEYTYEVLVDGQLVATDQMRTFPKHGSAGQFSVGFGGGAGYVPEWERMWDNILSFRPDAFLMLGDNVYIDQPESSITQQYCYYRRQSRPEWRRLTARTAIFSIWDDHDFGTNDCVPGPEIERPTWKRKVWNTFRHNWVNPGYGGGSDQPGCWYDFQIADVHFLMLDGRYYRDLNGGSMLGPVQKQWLKEKLTESTATFKVIASPVPFTAGIKQGSRDPWDGFPEEREEIFQHIESNRIPGVLLIAADRHRTDLRVTRRQNGYDLYEFESSRLTNHHTHRVVPTDGLIWGYNKTCSFALMEFDTRRNDPQITLKCIDLDGNIVASHDLALSQLTPR